MKISMMQVALATLVTRVIAHYPHSIAVSIANAITPITEYRIPDMLSLQTLSTIVESNMSNWLKDRSIPNEHRDAIRVDTMAYIQDPQNYAQKVYTRMRDDIIERRQNMPVVAAKYCIRYYTSIFNKGDKDNDSFLDIAEYKALMRSIKDENSSDWMTDDKVMTFGFNIMDHDNNEKIHLSEWTNLVPELIPTEIGLQGSGRSHIEC